MPDLLWQLGFTAESFASAEEFLESEASSYTRCLILDLAMPGMSGIELQRELRARRLGIPIVFITAHADSVTRPSLLRDGAIECLSKPFSDSALLAAVELALRGTRT